MKRIVLIICVLGVIAMGWAELVAAAQVPESEPLARVTVRPNPFVGDQAMDWSLLGDFTGTGPLDGVTTDNDVLVIVSADGEYKIITDGQSTAQWDVAWTNFASPSGAWGVDSEIIAIATDGTDIQVFARKITAPFDIYVNESNNDGGAWGGWVDIGDSTYTNGVDNYVIGAAVIDTVFLRHYETNGICLEVFNNEGAVPWVRYELETNLQLEASSEVAPPSGGCDVVQYGTMIYVYIGALHRDPAIYTYQVYTTTFYAGQWESVDYLTVTDIPNIESLYSLFAFHIAPIYGLTHDVRAVVAPAIEWEDGFEGYGDFWLKLLDFEADETWTALTFPTGSTIAGAIDNTNYVEAAAGYKITCTFDTNDRHFIAQYSYAAPVLDLSQEGRFTDDDYVTIAVYLDSQPVDGLYLWFMTDFNHYYQVTLDTNIVTTGWHFYKVKRGDFAATGAPNWNSIAFVRCSARRVLGVGTQVTEITWDDLRIVKADPGDSSVSNDTGSAWDFPSGEWHVYNEDDDSTITSLGQIDVDAGVDMFAVRHAWPQRDDYEIVVPVKAKRDDGFLGIAFRMTDTTPGSEDGYALMADTGGDLLRLASYVNGARGWMLFPSFTFDLDTWYYLGIRVTGSRIQGFCSTSRDTLFDAALIDLVDTTHTTGQVGLVGLDTVARFDSLDLSARSITEELKGLHLASVPDVWPSPILYEKTGYTYPRERIVYLGNYWYAFDESDTDFIVVQALSPIEQGADEPILAETVQIHLPLIQSSATSAQATVTLSNVYGEFDDSDALRDGAEIQIEGGYKWLSGEEYTMLFTGIINRISESLVDNQMKVTAYDYVYKLKKWAANRLFIFKSQFKVWLDLTAEDDARHLVDIVEGFAYDSTNEWYRSNTAGAENMVLHGEYFNDVVVETKAYFVDSFTDAWFGIILRSDSEGDNCYGILWNKDANTIQIHKKTDGTWGAQVATAALNAYHSASLWIRAEIIHDTIYVWTSADSIVWTYRISYADTSPLPLGHTGFVAYPAVGLSVDLREFTIYAFDTEKTVEYLMRQIATMAGVVSFLFEDEIYDVFTGDDADPPSSDNWRNGEKTLTTADINSNRLRCIAPDASWGYLNSTVDRKTFVLDFSVNIPNDAEPASIIFRTNTTFAEGYRLEIHGGAVGTARIKLVELSGSDVALDIYPRVAIATATMLDFTLSVQDNFDETQTFISLWLGQRLIFSCHSDSWPTAGYVGVGKYDDDNACYFDNFSIDMLDTPVVSRAQANYFVINVGEHGDKLIAELAAIQNARWFFDGDGVFVAGLLEPGDGVADVFDSAKTVLTLYHELYVGTRQRDDDGWISHVRVVANNGMYADAYDNTLLNEKGYRFKRIDVNAALSASQCLAIAIKYLEQQQKTGDTFGFSVTPAQFGLTRRMRFHAHAHRFPRDTTSSLKIDQDFIVEAQRISLKREPSPDWDMQIEPAEA